MTKRQIRSVIDRALEKGDTLSDFVAVPMLFDSELKRLSTQQGFIKTSEPHGIYYPISGVDVQRIWYTANSIELELSNDLHVSIQTKPLTLAMRISKSEEVGTIGFVQTQLIRHDEGDSNAALVEGRLRSLRQVYAIACIAFGGTEYTDRVRNEPLAAGTDFEGYLPANERLIITAAGEGSFWATVGLKTVAMAKAAPKAALVALSVIFKGGPERIARASEAIVKTQEGVADKSRAEARLTDALAKKAEAEAKSAQAIAEEAKMREQLEIEKLKLDLRKDQLDAYFHVLEKVSQIEDPDLRTALSASLNSHSKELLGNAASEWLQLPHRTS
jgi:hypothetical protein